MAIATLIKIHRDRVSMVHSLLGILYSIRLPLKMQGIIFMAFIFTQATHQLDYYRDCPWLRVIHLIYSQMIHCWIFFLFFDHVVSSEEGIIK